MVRKNVMSWLRSIKDNIEDMIPDLEAELDYIGDQIEANINFMTTHIDQFCDAIFLEKESGSVNVQIRLPNEEDFFAALVEEKGESLMESARFATEDGVKVEEAEEDATEYALLPVEEAEDDDSEDDPETDGDDADDDDYEDSESDAETVYGHDFEHDDDDDDYEDSEYDAETVYSRDFEHDDDDYDYEDSESDAETVYDHDDDYDDSEFDAETVYDDEFEHDREEEDADDDYEDSESDAETVYDHDFEHDGQEKDDDYNGGFADSDQSNFSSDILRHHGSSFLEQLLHDPHNPVMCYFVSDHYTEEFDGCADDDLSEYNTDEGDFSDDDYEIVSKYDVDELSLQLDKSQGIASMADGLPIQSDKSQDANRDSELNFVDEDCVMVEEDDYVLVG